MKFSTVLLIFATLIPIIVIGMDGILITSVEISMNQQFDKKTCNGNVSLVISNTSYNPLCDSQDGNNIYLTYNGTKPITGQKNITFLLTAYLKKETGTANFTGVFIPEKTGANALGVQHLTLNREHPNVTTDSTNTTDVTINFVHLQFDDNPPKEKGNNNGGAVAVAIIEGIALIAILAYAGYRTMVANKRKQTANLYGYDNNSRITVPDTIRMSDIPPPRDTSYQIPPVTPPARPTPTVMTTQELVVPGGRPQSSVSPQNPPPTTTNGQFADPFDSLDSW